MNRPISNFAAGPNALGGLMIRPATLSDATQIAGIHVRGWQAVYRNRLPDELLDNLCIDQRAGDWTEIIDGNAEDVAVCQLTSEIVGFVCFGASSDDDADATTGELSAIYIDPPSWRRGFGSELMEWTKCAARARGWRRLILWVMKNNSQARDFYQRSGWSIDEAVKFTYLGGSAIELVRYSWACDQ